MKPVTIMITKPTIIHGIERRITSVAGTRFMTAPTRRRSRIDAMPTKSASAQTWTDSVSGYM